MVSSQNKMILSDGKFSGTSRHQLKDAFDHLAASGKKTLVLHFHGGLVDQQSAENSAEQLYSSYEDVGGYPFFVMWKSGLLDVLQNIWQQARGEERFQSLVEKVTQLVLGKLNQSSVQKGANIVLPNLTQVHDEITAKQAANEVPFHDQEFKVKLLNEELHPDEITWFNKQVLGDNVYLNTFLSIIRSNVPEIKLALHIDIVSAITAVIDSIYLINTSLQVATAITNILSCVIKRLSTGRDHGIYTTVVEEVAREFKVDQIGGKIWHDMKVITEESFADPSDTQGGIALLDEITRLNTPQMLRIVLVGHSAGAVYICNFLKNAVKVLTNTGLRFEVVFLAPACSFDLLDETLQEASHLISNFRSFGMKDPLELQDAILRPVYDGSLLYFVSGLLEDSVDLPLVGMQRYHSQAEPYSPDEFPKIKRVLDVLAKYPDALIWSESSAGPGLSTTATHHGGFEEDFPTKQSVSALVNSWG